jgi:hypothetical protein
LPEEFGYYEIRMSYKITLCSVPMDRGSVLTAERVSDEVETGTVNRGNDRGLKKLRGS